MILMNLNSKENSSILTGRIKKGLEFLKNVDKNTPDGEIEIDGRDIYAVISTGKTQEHNERFYEAHKKYMDIHYVLSGEQVIKWLPVSDFKPVEYNGDNDFYKFEQKPEGAHVLMKDEHVALFFPEDAHMPLCKIDDEKEIRVCVVKVKI